MSFNSVLSMLNVPVMFAARTFLFEKSIFVIFDSENFILSKFSHFDFFARFYLFMINSVEPSLGKKPSSIANIVLALMSFNLFFVIKCRVANAEPCT